MQQKQDWPRTDIAQTLALTLAHATAVACYCCLLLLLVTVACYSCLLLLLVTVAC